MDNKPKSLLIKLNASIPSLSKTEQIIARYICDNPEKTLNLSISGLSIESGVSEATIIRMIRHFGLNSFQELKIGLAQDLVSPLQTVSETISDKDTAEDLVKKMFASSKMALDMTLEILDYETLEKVATIISQSRKVLIYGVGNSYSTCIDIQHRLLRLGIDAYSYNDPSMSMISACNTSKKDAVIAISYSGSSKDVVESTTLATKKGARTISITNYGPSPLSRCSEINIFTASKENVFSLNLLNARIALMAIFDSITAIIALRNSKKYLATYKEIEQSLKNKKF